MTPTPHTSAAAAVNTSLLADLHEITTLLEEAQTELAAGNINGALGAAAAAETTVARVTALHPAFLLLLRQQRP